MALKKAIELDNGIVVNYHRITTINKVTNVSTIIEVSSYISEVQRNKEAQYQEIQKKAASGEPLTPEEEEILNKGINVFIDTTFINKEYDEEETIEDLYAYLKTTEKFKDAEDC